MPPRRWACLEHAGADRHFTWSKWLRPSCEIFCESGTIDPTAPIRTARLILTPLHPDDASDMVGVLADPDLYTFTGGEPPTLDQLEERYRFQAGGSPREDEIWHNWIVRCDDVAIGYVQATVTGEDAELAWVIGTQWQGRGYAREAAAAMKSWLADEGALDFSAHIHPDHHASARVAIDLGLHPSGQLDEEGEMIWRLTPLE